MNSNNICELSVGLVGLLLFCVFTYLTTTIYTILLVIKVIKKSDNISFFVEAFGIGGILFNIVVLFIFFGWLIKLVLC